MRAGYRFDHALIADAFAWHRNHALTLPAGPIRDMTLSRVMVRETAVREALGRWVSELEPVLVYDVRGRFIGLTHAGQPVGGYPAIHVPIKGGVPI